MSNYNEEENLIRNRRGKWSDVGVPHKGWSCVDIEDLGSPEIQCEMCESQTIRYVHHMQHPTYPHILKVGCVCGGHMESDLLAAQLRETSMKNRASKRKRWLSRKWKLSLKGNQYLKTDGYRITVYERDSRWGATVSKEDNLITRHLFRMFENQDEAKLGAFDLITLLESDNS